MSYPYPLLTKQLQFLCTPEEYQEIATHQNLVQAHVIVDGRASESQYPEAARYLSILPTYTYAECPICHIRCVEKFDTYGLRGPNFKHPLGYSMRPRNPVCPHFFGYHIFDNLHNQEPIEVEQFKVFWGEVPYITSWLIADDLPSVTVLHGLPICRIENGQFVPTYTMFLLTYFSEDPDWLYERFKQQERDHYSGYYLGDAIVPLLTAGPSGSNTISYDLEFYAQNGRLGWMDVNHDEMPLRIGKGIQLPDMYKNINGTRGNVLYWGFGKFWDVL